MALASAASAQGLAGSDWRVVATAERALGLAARELSDITTALSHLRRAVAVAVEHELEHEAAEARVTLSFTLAIAGNNRGALREVAAAATSVNGPEAAQLETQRALILQRLGRHEDALEGYRRALPVLRRAGDKHWEARLLNNRGILRAFLGEPRAAQSDLVRAERLYGELGQGLSRAYAHHNLGFAAGREGDVPRALEWFDRCDEYFRAHDISRAEPLIDRCEVLLSARLVREARRTAEQAVSELERNHKGSTLAEGRLVLAEAALLDGDFATAHDEAERARRAFMRQHRARWAALARHAALRAAWRAGSDVSIGTARRAATALAAAGWATAALEARVIAGQIALREGRLQVARRELEQAAAARRRGPVGLRVSAWHAQALLRNAEGDRRGTTAAVNAGLRLLEQHRASLGATELRAYASEHGLELATLGVRLALEHRDAHRVFAAAERWRAGTLWLRPVRPPDDRDLADDLASLRQVTADIEQAALSGAHTATLLHRQAALEASIRRRSRRSAGLGAHVTPRVSVAALSETLAERALLELVAIGGTLHAVVVAGGRATLHDLGPVERITAEIDWLRFGLQRLAVEGAAGRDTTRSQEGASRAAVNLDALLIEPLAARVGDRPLVVVPTAALHALPWAALPSLQGRPLTIAPSASAWHARASAPPAAHGDVVLVAGPDVERAHAELESLARLYPSARRLENGDATAASVLAALDGAQLAHVAAHGSFRADNPLFSSLRVDDGPVTVYDLEALGRAPSTLVLSACESGLSGVRPGDELMGLASVLLALGTNVLVASIIPVPDEATRRLMCVFHEELAAGAGPAAALAAAQARVAADGPAGLAAAAGFLCLGGA